MAVETEIIRVHLKVVTGHGRLSLADKRRGLHVTSHTLVGNGEGVRTRLVWRPPGSQFTHRTQQHVVLQRVMRFRDVVGPRRPRMIVALAAYIDLGIVEAGE